MSTISLFDVEFRYVKAAAALPSGPGGSAYQYTLPTRRVRLAAASAHPKDILTVLNNDLTGPGGTSIEIISVIPCSAIGTEGNVIYS